MTAAIIDGPLLQRASTIVSTEVTLPIAMNISKAQQLPIGYTSQELGRTNYPAVLQPAFAAVMKDYSQRAPIILDGCGGRCVTSVQAAGFAIDCQSPSSVPVSYAPHIAADGSVEDPLEWATFSSDLSWSPGCGGQ